jgi:hypothetical protein
MRILMWHVHGSWTTSFVQGAHEYLVPVTPDRDADGLGRARTWDWPDTVREVPADRLGDLDFDVMILQRPHEVALAEKWTKRVPGRDVPAAFLEHNTPEGDVPRTPHPLAGQSDIPVVHVTHFNRLFWDCGLAPTLVVEHGVIDPGYQYTGEVARAAVAVNDPVPRGRVVGTDLLARLAEGADLDIFGMRVTRLVDAGLCPPRGRVFEDLPQARLHRELARRRVYLHTTRWTSLGLSLIEAMMLGMPVVGLASTEAPRAVPRDAGILSTDVDELVRGLDELVHEPDLARAMGNRARSAACARYPLDAFLDRWDDVLARLAAGAPVR